MVFELIKNYKPFSIAAKTRKEGNFLIVMADDLSIYYLNQVALDFYNLCDGTISIEKALDILINEYDVDIEILKKDIMILIRDLQWSKIIRLKI
jgi:hypothetical protein